MRREFCVPAVGTLLALALWAAPAASAATLTVDDTSTDAPLATATSTTCVSSDGHGGCTLRAAVEAADNADGASSIALPARKITFSIAPVNQMSGGNDDPANGDLDVDQLHGASSPPATRSPGWVRARR